MPFGAPMLVGAVDQLDDYEGRVFRRLRTKIRRQRPRDTMLDHYYEGTQRLKHLGLAVPGELRQFETVLNIPRMAVDEPQRRTKVRSLIMPGSEQDDPHLRNIYDDNNLDASLPMLWSDVLIYGRGYLTVSANPNDVRQPIINVEHAPDIAVLRDIRTHRVTAALRLYRDEWENTRAATLYLPNKIILLDLENGWKVTRRLEHTQGVPVTVFVNKQRTGSKHRDGTTEMADVIGLTDSISRTITNMQVAAETTAIPQRYVVGATTGDFIDAKTRKPLPVWEAYFTSIWTLENPEAKPGTFEAGSLKQFTDAVDSMMAWCAAVMGLPTRYMGQQTVNPATEGAIKADVDRAVANVENKELSWGVDLGITLGKAYSILKQEEVNGNRIRVVWHDPSTPTLSERADALQKLAGGKAILSREGVWDELGWSEPRKQRERGYFKAELDDPTIEYLGRDMASIL